MNEKIEKAKKGVLIKYPGFGTIMSSCEFFENSTIYSNGIPTIATEGKNIYYHPQYLSNVSEEQLRFDISHEISHIALDHIRRGKEKDQETWNIATDAVINAQLKKDGLIDNDNGVDMPEAINYDAEELYNKLLAEKQESKQKDSSEKPNDSNNNENNEYKDSGHDTHSLWESGRKKIDNKSLIETEENKEDNTNNQISEKQIFQQNRDQRRKLLEELRNSTVDEIMNAGKSTNSNYLQIGNIGNSQPLIEWKRILSEIARVEIDWSYQNAFIDEGVVTPVLEELPKPETEIILDTSGSINKTLLINFLRECKNILNESIIKVGCFDTKFYGFTDIKTEDDIDNMQFIGGGGTDFNVAVNAFSERAENKIIFTDGQASMPSKPLDAIWIVFGNQKINPPGGKVIMIDYESLKGMENNIGKTR